MKTFDSIKFKMAAYWPLFTFTWPLFGNPYKMARPNTKKQNVRFQERMHLEKFQIDKIQNGSLQAFIDSHVTVIW